MNPSRRDAGRRNQAGFTIVELMIATVIFAMVLLVCMMAVIQVGRYYYKGIASARTQEKARAVSEEIASALKFTDADAIQVKPGEAYCIAKTRTRYTYVLNRQLKNNPATTGPEAGQQSRHVLWRDTYDGTPATCLADVDMAAVKPTPTGTELMGEHMALLDFKIYRPTGSPPGVRRVYIASVYGEPDLYQINTGTNYGLTFYSARCDGGTGSQFCASATLNTVIYARLQ
jgi:prepilin-type N-terminal cleavage/methylation domain-containing protein